MSIRLLRNTKRDIKHALQEKKRCKKQYPDWEDNEYNCGPLKYIWGVQSDGQDATNFYQLTDLDIYYNRDTHKYMLGIETIYIFDSNQARMDYLLLSAGPSVRWSDARPLTAV